MDFLDQFRGLTFGWRDALEIAFVAYILYRGLLLVRGTRAVQILGGIVVLVVVYAVAVVLKLSMITYLLGLLFTYGVFAGIVEIAVLGYALVKIMSLMRRRLLLWHQEALAPSTV